MKSKYPELIPIQERIKELEDCVYRLLSVSLICASQNTVESARLYVQNGFS